MTGHQSRSCDIATACLEASRDAAGLVACGHSGDELVDRWARLHGRFVDLERRATALAATEVDLDVQRSLDHLASAVIALRAAVQVDVQRRLDVAPVPVLIEATGDIVVVRCEDVAVTAHRLTNERA